MASNEPKMRSITGRLVANELTDRKDDFTCNIVYQAKRSIKDLCRLAAVNSKFTASELESAYNDLHEQAKNEVYNAATVEFGFATNSLGIDGAFVGPDAQFDPSVNNVTMRCIPRSEYKDDLKKINVIVLGTSEGLPTITVVTDVVTGSVNSEITPNGGLNGTGNRVKIVGEEGKEIGFFFISETDGTETAVPATSLLRNEPSNFTFIIPQLAKGAYYLEIATQAGTNSKTMLKEPRRNRFPYLLYVGGKPGEEERPGEL